MKKQDLKALASMAVDRAVAAREVAGVELTDEQTASVAGGAGGLSYIKDPTWYGIWEVLKLPQPGAGWCRGATDRHRSEREARGRRRRGQDRLLRLTCPTTAS